MPWLAVPYQQTAIRAELAQLYCIRGIPTLLLLDNNGHVITTDARTELAEDPMAQVGRKRHKFRVGDVKSMLVEFSVEAQGGQHTDGEVRDEVARLPGCRAFCR